MIKNYDTAFAHFSKHGYDDKCELIDIRDGKLFIRCKLHGHEFVRDVAILTKPQKKLRCPECHECNVTAMLEWYASGHSTAECAERFGITKAQVTNYARSRGVHGGISSDEKMRRLRNGQAKGSVKGSSTLMKRAGERIRRRVALHGFEMLGEWHGKDAIYHVRCMKCGYEFDLKASTLKKCKFACPECPDPFDALREELDVMRAMVDAIGRELATTKAVLDRFDVWMGRDATPHADAIANHEPVVCTCKHCAGLFIYWPLPREESGYRRLTPPMYCSKRCRVKENKQPSNIGHRLRKYGNAEAPRDVIHLRDLYERDSGICQICGEPTDWNDFTAKPDGAFWYINGLYPTIDHIVPIAKGGTHTWDNVQLAHRDCNSAKSDNVQEESAA